MIQVSVCQSQSKLSQNHLTHALIQPSVIASNWCVRGGNKLNCFNAMQVLLGGPIQILIWGCRIAKGPTR